ncbi:MAG: hypothetical protein F6K09_10260, partial [Merismopedia sp. SIO2A8]|nr:hypothetical protein [Merismopedia sp. SIO2A8]
MGNPGFTIQLDYRFAGDAVSDRDRQILAEAARIWETFITDDFADIPAGTVEIIPNPSTNVDETVTFTEAVDDLLIFVGGQALGSGVLAEAGPLIGTGERYTGSDFQPELGTLTINTQEQLTLDTALHEIGHVLGFGTAPAFERLVSNNAFGGTTARAVNNNSPIPLVSAANGHVADNFALADGLIPLLIQAEGASGLPTAADLAILVDIGYTIPALDGVTAGTLPVLNYSIQGTDGDDGLNPVRVGTVNSDIPNNFPLAGLNGADIILGGNGNDAIMGAYIHLTNLDSDGGDRIDGGAGNDTIQGGGGDDLIIGGTGNDDLYGEGEEGTFFPVASNVEVVVDYSPTSRDTFAFDVGSGQDTIHDFGADYDTIQISPAYGFATPADVLSRVVFSQTLPDNRTQSTLTLSDGNVITIKHDKPLTDGNFVISAIPTIILAESG